MHATLRLLTLPALALLTACAHQSGTLELKKDRQCPLTLNKGQAEPYTHGDGYGHVAVCVDDARAEHRRFVEQGLEPNDVKEFHRDGGLMARFFFVQDPDGYKVEVLERHGRYQ